MSSIESTDISQLTPTFQDMADMIKSEFTSEVQLSSEVELAGFACRTTLGDIDLCVSRSSHAGNVYIEVNSYGIGDVNPQAHARVEKAINQINEDGIGGVVMVQDRTIVFRQSIAVTQDHLDCWQQRLRFLLIDGPRISLSIKFYLPHLLALEDIDTDPHDSKEIDANGTLANQLFDLPLN